MKCFDCQGKGEVFAFINRGPDISTHSQEWIACRTCDGTGTVSADVKARREAGKAWYAKTRIQGELMVDVAARLGLSVAQISSIKHGRAPVPND